MSRITLALALFYLPSFAHGLCSATSCEELGWSNAEEHVSTDVCGETDHDGESHLGSDGCSGHMNAADAELFCEGRGARLCTLSELEQDEPRKTGCDYDREQVWSTTACDNGSGFMTIEGSTPHQGGAVCTDAQDTSTVVARCCADTESSAACSTGSCFHGNGTVLLESGASKRLSEVNIGDRIKTSDDKGVYSFSPVVTLPHKKNTEPALFLTLTTETKKAVDMTSDHFIPTCDYEVLTAGELVVGDCVLTMDGKETLVEVTTTEKSGVYTAVTENKFIVVDGIVASPYSFSSKDDQGPKGVYEKYRELLALTKSNGFASKALKRLRGSLQSL
eukprot:CAMPEP_0171727302 /NCGR_PEP_ID=MMETSP0991-20121206/26228_1 /TAXON_ID=483369 /ORGANISM="non described non described, Strain CCMP2098" /LENGTH=333 /DNA_ID=CAMNT_0012321045 /DNA_START=26 /DNA_END=1027 /DNA_ORIENTATION=-